MDANTENTRRLTALYNASSAMFLVLVLIVWVLVWSILYADPRGTRAEQGLFWNAIVIPIMALIHQFSIR